MNLATLRSLGYEESRFLANGDAAGIQKMLFTWGLFVGLTEMSWRTRFCYETREDARMALRSWDGRGDPPGPWIKEKPSDRLGPGAA